MTQAMIAQSIARTSDAASNALQSAAADEVKQAVAFALAASCVSLPDDQITLPQRLFVGGLSQGRRQIGNCRFGGEAVGM